MARIKYYYDTETCKYERVKVTKGEIAINTLGFLGLAVIMAIGVILPLYLNYFDNSKEAKLRKENAELKLYYEVMDKEMKEVNEMLTVLQKRDDNVYRVIFEAPPIPSSIRKAGTGGVNRYKHLLEKGLEKETFIINTFEKISRVKKQMYIQTKSYDDILKMARDKSKMWASIPAIQPISNRELSRLASGFGRRMHPIYKVMRMHTGCDFAANRGTPIYSTGDGKVISVKSSFGGYGKEIQVDHGYGYVTRYAHMQSFKVKIGQKVKRGECIGTVGNTGTSTAPHLHYEVYKDGKAVNPVHYFYNDLNAEEYEKLLELASIENQSLS